MARTTLLPIFLLLLPGCTEVFEKAYEPVRNQIVDIVTEKKDQPACASGTPCTPATPADPPPANKPPLTR